MGLCVDSDARVRRRIHSSDLAIVLGIDLYYYIDSGKVGYFC
jgi:hypothetical protein